MHKYEVGDIVCRSRKEYKMLCLYTKGLVTEIKEMYSQVLKVKILEGPYKGDIHQWSIEYVELVKPRIPDWEI